MASERKDWEAIEREYRAGQLSVSEIGRQYGVSHTAINKKAKALGWWRDLSARVKQAVAAQLVSDGVSTDASPETEDAVKVIAARHVQVVREHRHDISRGNQVSRALFDELASAVDNRDTIEDEIELETKDDRDPKRRNSMLKAVALPSRAATLSSLALSLKTLIGLERQAFNLDSVDEPPAAQAGDTSDDRRRAAIALLLGRR